MTKLQILRATALLLAAGFVGYWLGARQRQVGVRLPVNSVPGLDYFITHHSFSEVENAKETLEGLSRRFTAEVQARRLLALDRGEEQVPSAAGTIKLLESGLKEFEGTGQELWITQDLLCALKTAKLYSRYLETYLKVLYEHPTHSIVAIYANDALAISKTIGRQEDVLHGFEHLTGIPFDFEAKGHLRELLIQFNALEPHRVWDNSEALVP